MREQLRKKRFEAALVIFQKKARTYAKNSAPSIEGMDVDDVEQELLWELWVAAEKYDPSKGARFNAFVQTLWRNRIGKLIRAADSISRGRNVTVISLDKEPLEEIRAINIQEEFGSLAATLKSLRLPPEKIGVCIALAMRMEPEDIYRTFDISRAEVEEIVEELQYDWEFFRHITQLVAAG